MEKEFIQYTEALALKELGFDEPCFAYFKDEEFQYPNPYEPFKNSEMKSWCITAPLYQQVFRWFRENYGLEGISQRAEDKVWYKFSIYLYLEDGKRIRYGGYEYLTSEEAELECLKALIEIVKEK
jgi:hypothetical protein